MNFHIKCIHLWSKEGVPPREIRFLPNKVNVITGGSGTGKTSILSIIDYCLLASDAKIPEVIINENVEWYGLDFKINEKDYVIIRKKPVNGKPPKEIYFSSDGLIPSYPKENNDQITIKAAIEREFSVDENLKVPYGGKFIPAGSKISFRYFLLLNTLSEDTIAHGTNFFDFHLHDSEKYMEALDRIFYLVIGADDVNNVLAKEKLEGLEKDLAKITKKKKALVKDERLFNEEIIKLLINAQEYDLIERKLFTFEEAFARLNELVNSFKTASYSNNMHKVDELNKSKRIIWRKIRNLERFNLEYEEYKKNIKNDYESLKSIQYLRSNYDELIPTLELNTFLKTLEESLIEIHTELSNKKGISVSTKGEIDRLKKMLSDIDKELAKLPTTTKDYTDEAQKFIYIGELKSRLEFYSNKWNIEEELPDEQKILNDISELNRIIADTGEKRRIMLSDLESTIQKQYDASNSMDVYKNYKVIYDVKDKALKVRKPNEVYAQANMGSKSNFMFLHLFLFLGLHEHFIKLKIPYIPPFLILDQPSQPYYDGDESKSDVKQVEGDLEIKTGEDKYKLQDAFKLLNDFITLINENYETDFQIIMLEHAPEKYWKDINLTNFHLVEEFRNGNALIQNLSDDKDKKDEDKGDKDGQGDLFT